jgi:hypothetical protein
MIGGGGGGGGGNHLIFANYKKAYGTRGYEAKTIIIKERRNPP